MFPIIEVPNDAVRTLEQLGTKAKFWFHDADGRLTLCKTGRKNTGEDWAEKLAAELAEALGLPHAEYELAVWRGEPCVVSRSIVPEGCTLITGNEVLTGHDGTYPLGGGKFKQPAHTLEAIWEALAPGRCELPLKWNAPSADFTARDIFTGYLVLDTLIGNTYRHDEIRWWRSKLESIDADRIDILLARVPRGRMPSDAVEFVRRMLVHNRSRILAVRLQS